MGLRSILEKLPSQQAKQSLRSFLGTPKYPREHSTTSSRSFLLQFRFYLILRTYVRFLHDPLGSFSPSVSSTLVVSSNNNSDSPMPKPIPVLSHPWEPHPFSVTPENLVRQTSGRLHPFVRPSLAADLLIQGEDVRYRLVSTIRYQYDRANLVGTVHVGYM